MAAARFRLCLLLTRELCRLEPLEVIEAAAAGGTDAVQLREKAMDSAQLLAWGREALRLCRALGLPLLVNDRVEVALAIGADGVHVGQDDLHPDDVRALVGPERLIGWSTHDLEQLDAAADLGVDYAGFGPVFATSTKGYAEGLGPEHLAAAIAIARVPVLAIGGIVAGNAWMIPEPAGLAVSSALCAARDPQAVAAALVARRTPAP
ncbi:MAG TPA: thiamine phosphate synthase [Planctomycetota bacterium]